jgi:hypothetical protein
MRAILSSLPTRPVERWFAALCLAPWLLVGAAYVEATLAALTLGHWPRPSHDDPMSLATAPIHYLTLTAIVAVFPALATLGVSVIANWREVSASPAHTRWLAACVGGAVVLSVLVRLDPGQVWYWLGD